MRSETQPLTGQGGLLLMSYRWLPEDAPRGIVLLSHGLGEHAGRYTHVAAHLTARGWAVFAVDHRGHGRSGGTRVLIDDFDVVVDDFSRLYDQARNALPGLPVVVYGHSMGTLVALLFALDHQAELAGLVLTGCALRPPMANPALLTAVRVLNHVIPKARLVPELNLHAISRDPAVVAAYAADPLVYHGKLPVTFGVAGARAIETIERRLPELRLPVLAMHGSEDQLTLPAGTHLLAERAALAPVTVRIWDGLYHEVHNEPEQAAVLDEIAAWLEARLTA